LKGLFPLIALQSAALLVYYLYSRDEARGFTLLHKYGSLHLRQEQPFVTATFLLVELELVDLVFTVEHAVSLLVCQELVEWGLLCGFNE
jgi:hypothetical protein